MCIRDSRGTNHEVCMKFRFRETEHVPARRIRCGSVEDLEAVSYTHLRAHETVLDIVCRLLLEKKNNKTYNV